MSTPAQAPSLVQQMAADGSLPDMGDSPAPMRAVVAAASTANPDAEAKTQQLAQRANMPVDLTRANPQAAQQRAIAAELDRRELEITNPVLAAQLRDPKFAAVAHDDLDSLTGIEQGAAELRAWNPTIWDRAKMKAGDLFTSVTGTTPTQAVRNAFNSPLRMVPDAIGGAAGFAGNVGSFVGWHGDGPTRQNLLQRVDTALSPESVFANDPYSDDAPYMKTGEADTLVKGVAPMLPVIAASGGMSLLMRALNVSDKTAKVLLALGVGSAFSADQGGQTFTQEAAAGKSDAEARRAAMTVAGITALPNMAMGLTDFVPALERNPLLTALGVGGGTGATGQLAQNVVTGQPWNTKLLSGAEQGAAMMGGMHIGFGAFGDRVGQITDAVEASKLRARSPEAFQQSLNETFAGDESLRVPAKEFVDYFQGKNLDPAAMASQLEVGNLAEAAEAGTDLEIPKANFFGKLDAEHQRGLRPDIVDPATEMTTRQAQEGQEELKQWAEGGGIEKLQAEYAAADAETQATPEWQKIFGDLKQRYLDRGEPEAAADGYATLQANAYANLARGAGLKPDELLALHNPELVAGEAPPALYQAGKNRNIEAARAQGELLKPIPAPAESEGASGAEPGGTVGPGATGDGAERGGTGDESVDGAAAERADSGDGVGGKRGWFRILANGRYEIGKTKVGDFSTFIHEPAHAYLELFRELTGREGASDALKSDFKKITDWLGTTPEEAHEKVFTTEQHEKWATANEQYAREGKAPTSGLRRAFHNFAVWLGSIYHRAGDLGVELSPEIKGVMDRLYAGEESVNRALREQGPEPESPEEAGLTEAEYRNYAEAKGIAADKAREEVHRELNEAAVRERTEKWREEKSNVREAVTQEIDSRPEYRAIKSLRRGALDDETPLTLNRDALVQQFGEDRVRSLQRIHPGLYRAEGGTDAETASELFGYHSGEEMMRALENAPRRAVAIEQGTRDYMTARHGDIRYDGTLDDKARLAVENDERAKSLHAELDALRGKVAGLEKKAADAKTAMQSIALEPLEHYQEAARQMVDQKAIADLQPYRYLNASRKFSRDAFDALRKGDVKGAADAKNKELLNHFLFREASAARDYATKFESYAKRMQSKGVQQRLGLAQESSGVDYRDQFNWLLARYRMGPATAMPERALRAWAEEVYGAGNEPAIAPGILDSNKYADYRSVPLSEVHDLHDALVNVRHLAMREFKMFVQGKQVDFNEAKQAMIARARESLRAKPEKVFSENQTAGERAAGLLASGDAMLVRMERLVEWLDGGKTGPWHDNLWNLAADAQGDEYALQEKVTKPILDAIHNIPEAMRTELWTKKVSVEGIGEPITRRRMLSIALNMGNEGNLDRLRKTFTSFGWDPDATKRIGGMLTQDEWQFVQQTLDSLKPIGARMKDLETRLTGLPPAMVKATPFKVGLDDGTEMDLDGGYYPIKMDTRFSQRAIEQGSKESAQNAMQSGYVRATTSKGYTKERSGFGGPLDLDFESVLTDHLAKSIKDISHREFMLASQRFLLDTEIRKTLRETLGPAYEKQFMPWLRTIINDRNGSSGQGVEALSNAMQRLRGNIVTASLGFKVSTSLLQITHAPRMMLYAKPGSIAQSLVDFLAHPAEMSDSNRELSPNEMKFRGPNLDRDVRGVLQDPAYREGYTHKVATAARWTLQTIDHLFSHTLWRAAYRDALAKYADMPEDEAQKKAVYEADSAVRLGLGTAAPKDLPAIMRNNDFNKMITTLYGFHNGVYNQMRDIGHQFRYDGNVGKLTYAGILTAVVPALLGALVTGDGPKDGENIGSWAAKRALLFSVDTVPILGSVAQFMARGRDMQFTPIESVMEKGAKAAMEISSAKEDKDWVGIGLDTAEASGMMAGVPGSRQAVASARYIKRASEGKIASPSIWGAVVGH